MTGLSRDTVSVFDSSAPDCPRIPVVLGPGNAKVVMWPGNGAIHRTMTLLQLEAGSKTLDFEHGGEAVYYVIEGTGSVLELSTGTAMALREGSMVHVGRGDAYRFEADQSSSIRLIGGPCPADTKLYVEIDGTFEEPV